VRRLQAVVARADDEAVDHRGELGAALADGDVVAVALLGLGW
jgi:hypothetical protein